MDTRPLSEIIATIIVETQTYVAQGDAASRKLLLDNRSSQLIGMIDVAIKLRWPDEYIDALFVHRDEIDELWIDEIRDKAR
jgi:hypothetical protein